MPSSKVERKLAAIMFTDIAGYTEQMSKDEAEAISLLNKKDSILKPLIAENNGIYVKSTGDGSLSHFNSAVDATTCAKILQESIYDDKALDYYNRALAIGGKRDMGQKLNNIGVVHYRKGDYNKVVEHLEKSLAIQKDFGFKGLELVTTTYLYLSLKHLGKDYDINEIHSLIKETENIEFDLNFGLYQLLEDTSYLETAYNQVQEKASAMEKELAEKFLSYPIAKQIVEEWEKLTKH